jgi:hypothetical protein
MEELKGERVRIVEVKPRPSMSKPINKNQVPFSINTTYLIGLGCSEPSFCTKLGITNVRKLSLAIKLLSNMHPM